MVVNRVESHFTDPNPRFKKFFEKERLAENRGVDFEIGDKDTSEFNADSVSAFFFFFCGGKKVIFKSYLDLWSLDY